MREAKKIQMQVAKVVSDKLGNTPAMARDSYIDPHVWAGLFPPDNVKKLSAKTFEQEVELAELFFRSIHMGRIEDDKVKKLLDKFDKFDPSQPRIPAGSPRGGQWAASGGGYVLGIGSPMKRDAVGDETVLAAIGDLRTSQPHDTLDDLYAVAPIRQAELAAAGSEIAADLGVVFKDPGIKDRVTSAEKLVRKGYKSPKQLADVIRAGFLAQTPEQADRIVDKLAKKFVVVDEGWNVTPAGYFDRKLTIAFRDGLLGEVQIWEPKVLAAKNSVGHGLYEQARSLPAGPVREKLEIEMRRIYASALAEADPSFRGLIGGGPAMSSVARKRSDHLDSDMMLPESNTSISSTIDHVLPSVTAQASYDPLPISDSNTAGRWSHERNCVVDLATLASRSRRQNLLEHVETFLTKYNPSQPRVPSGSPFGGRWVGRGVGMGLLGPPVTGPLSRSSEEYGRRRSSAGVGVIQTEEFGPVTGAELAQHKAAAWDDPTVLAAIRKSNPVKVTTGSENVEGVGDNSHFKVDRDGERVIHIATHQQLPSVFRHEYGHFIDSEMRRQRYPGSERALAAMAKDAGNIPHDSPFALAAAWKSPSERADSERLQDFASAVTNCHVGKGHSRSYYEPLLGSNLPGDVETAAIRIGPKPTDYVVVNLNALHASEAFANYISLRGSSSARPYLDKARDFFPNTVKAFDDMLDRYTRVMKLLKLFDKYDHAQPRHPAGHRLGGQWRPVMTTAELATAARSQESHRRWYQDTDEVVGKLFGNDAKLMEKFLAVTSENNTVKGNIQLALKAYAQWREGKPFTGYTQRVIEGLKRASYGELR